MRYENDILKSIAHEKARMVLMGGMEETNIVQAIDYYPFGLEAKPYTRTAADPTQYLYNAGAEKNDLTGYYETFFRNYDASIGRFNGVDIAVNKYPSQTPYNYAFNDPVLLNDPLGDDLYDCDICSSSNVHGTYAQRWARGGNSYAARGYLNDFLEDGYLINMHGLIS